MAKARVPSFDTLMNPVLVALRELGGSGTVEEINHKVAELEHFSDEQLEVLHSPDRGTMTEIEYRLAWTRTYLGKYGVLENSSRGVWALTPLGRQLEKVDEKEVVRVVREGMKAAKKVVGEGLGEEQGGHSWREELIGTLIEMKPPAFERLVQRILRESGFVQVEVTGRTGDGGVDGKGILRLGGLLSFHVIYQCKKTKGTVTAGEIRDFRGAMVGRADKGLLITTGTFTRGAEEEARRDGAPAIDLIDGDQLAELLKRLSLGIRTETVSVEQVTVERQWFSDV